MSNSPVIGASVSTRESKLNLAGCTAVTDGDGQTYLRIIAKDELQLNPEMNVVETIMAKPNFKNSAVT